MSKTKNIEVVIPGVVANKFSAMCKAVGMTESEASIFIAENGVSYFLSLFDRFYQI